MQLIGHIRAREFCIRWLAIGIVTSCAANASFAQQPNIVIISIDDMGWGDFGVYGSTHSQTPNINSLANQGTRFTQFYAGAPICSPSRASLLTGQYSARSGINTFIDNTTANLASDNANHLSLAAPSMARTFRDNGYATGHFGKWHLGGGRDVGYATGTTAGTNATAPRVMEYGYDEAWTQMEGLGNRIINVVDYGGNANGTTTRPSNYMNGLNQQSEARGTGGGLDQLVYLEREHNATFMINRAIEFVDDTKASNPNQPFFMNVWLDETHTPHDPPATLRAKYNSLYPGLPTETRDFLAVLEHTDQQIGRLINHIDRQGFGDDTLILVMADNGAVGVNANNIDSTGPFRGTKGHLFEGGMRQPLIARWTGSVAANRTDTDTVIWMPDLFPTLTQVAGIANPSGVTFDGENLSEALLGNQSQVRSSPLFWNMNRGTSAAHSNPNSSGAGANGQEVLGVRNGKWKLLINAQGTAPELYDIPNDPAEGTNRAQQNQAVVNLLSQQALSIRYSTPSRTLPDAVTPLVRLKAQDLASLGNGAAVDSWSDTATGDSFNGSVSQSTSTNRPTLQTNMLNGRSVVSFDGNDSLLSSTSNSLPTSGKGITVIAVASGDTSGNAAQRLGQVGSHNGTAGKIVGLDVSGTATSTNNGGAGFRFNNGASLYDTPISNAGFHIVTWQVDDGQSYADAKLLVDGTLPANTFTGASTSTETAAFSGNDLELILGTGRSGSGALFSSDYYTGQLAEFLVFNEQLSIGQINLVANYLSTEYALPFAYDTNLLFSQSALLGDYNHNGVVDTADYVVWRKTGINGQQGFVDWRSNFGNSTSGFGLTISASTLTAQVPEPGTWVILAIGAILVHLSGRSKMRFSQQLM
jgi:arylsulfatase A-like enzyme